MTYESYAKNIRNAMVGIVVVVLSGLVGCPKPKDGAKDGADVPGALDPSDVIEIVVEEKALTIPEELRKAFGDRDTVSFALVNSKGQLTAFSVDGVPSDLCGPSEGSRDGSRTCKEEVPSQDLMLMLSSVARPPPSGASDSCGKCRDEAGKRRNCRKATGMRPCSTEQFDCSNECQ